MRRDLSDMMHETGRLHCDKVSWFLNSHNDEHKPSTRAHVETNLFTFTSYDVILPFAVCPSTITYFLIHDIGDVKCLRLFFIPFGGLLDLRRLFGE